MGDVAGPPLVSQDTTRHTERPFESLRGFELLKWANATANCSCNTSDVTICVATQHMQWPRRLPQLAPLVFLLSLGVSVSLIGVKAITDGLREAAIAIAGFFSRVRRQLGSFFMRPRDSVAQRPMEFEL